MREAYQSFVESASSELCEAIMEHEKDLFDRARLVDGDVLETLREVGWLTMGKILSHLCSRLGEEAKAQGLSVQARPVITFQVIFGPLELESPYLWKKGQSSKPVKDRLGITHQGRSEKLERALTDFGIEESFGQASKRFEEHYGWLVDKTSVRRVTKMVASEAEAYLDNKLKEARRAYDMPLSQRQGAARLLAQLDGCQIRTAEHIKGETPRRKIDWHEVRTGLVTGLDGQEKRYVGRMESYPEAADQLFSLAVEHGLSKKTKVIAVADGAKGLREELERQFPNILFSLDRPHFKQHLHQTAEALGNEGDDRHQWMENIVELTDRGEVQAALRQLRAEYASNPVDRLRRLIGYIERFHDAIHYEDFKEQGFPIGSGEIESAHRYIPQKRLKILGACWSPESINPMVALRALRANQWWEQFWENRPMRRTV
jgi:hypothetical protein